MIEMWIDFHVHGKLTKSVDFDLEYFNKVIDCAKDTGLDSFVLSEHFNTKDYYTMYRKLEENFEYINDYYLIDGFKVFMGMEVDVENGGHVVLVSNRTNILNIRKRLDNYTNKGEFIPFKDLLDLADEYNCIKIGAHPYRGEHPLAENQEIDQLKRLDALDLNAKDVFTKGYQETHSELEALSNKLGNNIVTGSDSHYPTQLGSVKTNLGKDCETIEDIRACIKSGNYEIEISDVLDIKVYSASTTKKHLKAQLVG